MPDYNISGGVATIHNDAFFDVWENRPDYVEALATAGPPELAQIKRAVLDFEVALAKTVREGRILDDIDTVFAQHIGDEYVQHDPNVDDGRDSLADDFRTNPTPAAPAVPVSVIAEGDLVFLILQHRLPDPDAPESSYDMFTPVTFRVRDGKMVEHWDGRPKFPSAA